MRFSLATIALVGNALFSVNGAPTGLSHREAQLDIPKDFAERAFIPPKAPLPKPEPVPGPSAPKPAPKPIEPIPITPHPDVTVTGGSSTRPQQGIDPAIPKGYEPKPVPEFGTEPGKYPYKIDRSDVQPGAPGAPEIQWGTAYEVRSTVPGAFSGPSPFVNKIAVNKDTDTVSIIEAWNALDKPPIGQKLFLSDIMMSVFKQQGKNPTDLKAVHVDAVVNDKSSELFEDILEAMGKSQKNDRVTFSATDADKTNFNKIAASPFGLAIDRANQQFSTGKTAQSYTLSPNKELSGAASDMDVVLG